jgi:hypothetical protein
MGRLLFIMAGQVAQAKSEINENEGQFPYFLSRKKEEVSCFLKKSCRNAVPLVWLSFKTMLGAYS